MEVWAIELVSQCIHTLVKHTYKTEMLKIAPFMLLLSAFVLWSNAYHSTLNLTLTQTVSHPSLSAGKKGRKRMWPNRFTPVVCIPFTFKVVLISFFFFFFFFLFSFPPFFFHMNLPSQKIGRTEPFVWQNSNQTFSLSSFFPPFFFIFYVEHA